jgi:hypothetical protein
MCGRFMALRGAAKMRRVLQIVAGVAAVVLFGNLNAQAADPPKPQPGTADWAGLNWGLGIAVDFDVGQTRVGDVVVVGPNNIVRVDNTSSNASVGFVLEAHYFLRDFILPLPKKVNCGPSYCYTEVGYGPFVALEIGNGTAVPSGNSGPITGYALGLMVGLHHLHPDAQGIPQSTDTKSWNFGIGLRVDPNAHVLGDGIVANQPLPPGEPTNPVRLKQEPRLGVMLLSSFSF